MFLKTVSKIHLLQGRYRIEVQEGVAGNIVLLEGIDQYITKTSTIISAEQKYEDADIIIPLKFWTQPIIKIAI
jgi:U5 small nuclear ribonucleoprotein component